MAPAPAPLALPVQVVRLVDPDVVAHDLLCLECGETSRVHPRDSWVAQVRVFLDQHRHTAA